MMLWSSPARTAVSGPTTNLCRSDRLSVVLARSTANRSGNRCLFKRLTNELSMGMRHSCINFEGMFFLRGDRSRCKLGLAPDAPKKCPPNISSFERSQVKKKAESTKSLVDQLNTLARLRKSGDITGAEFQELKSRLISESDGLTQPVVRSARPVVQQPDNGPTWNTFLGRVRR